MGWDAFSSVKTLDDCKPKHPEPRRLFRNAHLYVKRKAGSVDGYLEYGSLDCSDCRRMLEEATGESCYDENGWSKEKVRDLQKSANWNFEYDPEDAWAYWSARKFLEVCAKLNLSIEFSW